MTVTTAEQIASAFPDAPIGKVVIGKLDKGWYPVTIGRRKPKHFNLAPAEAPELVLSVIGLLAEAMSPEQRKEYLTVLEGAVNPVRAPRRPRTPKGTPKGAPTSSKAS